MAAAMPRLNHMPPHVALNIVRAFGKTVEKIEPSTADHLNATGRFAARLARRLRFGPAACRVIHLGAVLHDVGKVAVPPTLLLRRGRLSEVEFALVREHPSLGFEIVSEAGLDPAIAAVIRQHHERLDGSGYPNRLKDGEIMAETMVVAVADEVHALASHRAYREGMGEAEIVRILETDAAARLPRHYVDCAIDLMRADAAVH